MQHYISVNELENYIKQEKVLYANSTSQSKYLYIILSGVFMIDHKGIKTIITIAYKLLQHIMKCNNINRYNYALVVEV